MDMSLGASARQSNDEDVDDTDKRRSTAALMFDWLKRLVDRCGRDAVAIALAIHLRDIWDRCGGKVFPGKATLAERLGVSVRYVEMKIKVLVAAGLIRVITGGGRGRRTEFQLILEETANHSSTKQVSTKQETSKALTLNLEPGFAKPRSPVRMERELDSPIGNRTEPRSRGTRWPDNAVVSEEWIAAAQASRRKHNLPDIDLKLPAVLFANHWASAAGTNASKKDWKKTWINWALKERASPNTKRLDRDQHHRTQQEDTNGQRALRGVSRLVTEDGRAGVSVPVVPLDHLLTGLAPVGATNAGNHGDAAYVA